MEIINKYFPDLNDSQRNQFAALYDAYKYWNERINVVSRKDFDQLYERHVLHSLGIAKFIQFKANSSILDVGTGGGFPGIPLAIMNPESKFYLVDSIAKKIKVVNEVSNAIGLKNVRAEQIRAEKIKEDFDFIVSRAVTQFPEFYNWVRQKIKKENKNSQINGILYLKGGDLSEELKGFKKIQLYPLSDYFEESFFDTKKLVYLPF